MVIKIQDIRNRAHELWENAGKPEGREEEFWQQAERELKEKETGRKLESPDDI
jgi:Protein of unknown function (DUF2934)